MNMVLPDSETEHRLAELVDPERPILKIRPAPESWCFDTALRRCADDQLAEALLALREQNTEFLQQRDEIAVVIEGRLDAKEGGYLGDAIQCSRVLRPLREHFGAERILVACSHANMIDSAFHPADLPASDSVSPLRVDNNEPYWDSIATISNTGALLTPTLGRFASPLNFGIKLPSNIPAWQKAPLSSVYVSNGNFEREGNILRTVIIDKKRGFYSKGQMHLSEALRFWLELFGVSGDHPFHTALTTEDPHPQSLAVKQYYLEGEKKRRRKAALPDLIDGRIPLVVFPDTVGKKCKKWPADHWCELMKLLAAAEESKRLQIIFSKYKDTKDYQKIRGETRRSGFAVTEMATGSPSELIRIVRYLTGLCPDVITLGLDSMGAGHLGPLLGTHSVVVGHRHRDYGGDPIFSAPMSDAGKTCILALPRAGQTNASDVAPADVCYAVAAVLNEISP